MNTLTISTPLHLDQNPAAVYIASLGGSQSSGGRTQAQALQAIASIFHTDALNLNWSSLRYQHTAMVRAQLMTNYAPATANKILSALRQTLKQAWLLGQMTAEDYTRAIELEPITGSTIPAGRELSVKEIHQLIDACKRDTNPHAGTRDAAIIGILYAAGLRRDELVKLSLSSIDLENGQIQVTGKRNKQRTVYITNGALDALKDWTAIRGATGEALFVEVNKSGKLFPNKNITPDAIYKVLEKRAKQAGIKEFSPHDLRRTFVSHLLGAGADIATVSKMAGHANIQTTARYDRRPEDEKRKAASLLSVPY